LHGEDATRKMPAAGRAGARRGTAGGRRRGRRRPLGLIGQGALRGGLGVCIIIAAAALGAAATIATRAQPGLTLGLFVLAGTVAAALTIEPRAGRLIFPVPALAYLVAALVAGGMYNRSADNAELAVGAAQWIANGFFVMVLATLLAIALTTVRWFLWRRSAGAGAWGEPRSPGGRPPQGPPPPPGPVWPQRPGWPEDRPQGPGRTQPPRPGSGPYNFSSGA
jgi:hypothetical protein